MKNKSGQLNPPTVPRWLHGVLFWLIAPGLALRAGELPATVEFAYEPDDAMAAELLESWPYAQIRAAGWLRVKSERHSRRVALDGVVLLASTRSGWTLPVIEHYLKTQVSAFGVCGIGLAPVRVVLLESFPAAAEGSVGDDAWMGSTGLARKLAGRARFAVMFADRIRTPDANASIGGLAVFYAPLPHVIIARHNRNGAVFKPELTLPHEFAHLWLGRAHDAPGGPRTIMAARSCKRCRFSPTQCSTLRERVARPWKDYDKG